MLSVSALFVLGAALAVYDYHESVTEITGGIMRNTYGQGIKTETLKVESENEKRLGDIEVKISERSYTTEEVKALLKRSIKEMESWILGGNESLDHIDSDMKLIREVPGEPVTVEWELDRYDVMGADGTLYEDKIQEKTLVTLKAVLTYREDREEQALYECTAMVCPKTLTGREKLLKTIEHKISENNEETKTDSALFLPQEAEGETIHFYPEMEQRGIVLIIMSLLILLLLYALDRQNQGQELEKRQSQMRLDYSEIVSRLTLLLGAGMTVKRAWKKIAQDYDRREDTKKRYAYEEIKYTCREMESGVMESESYERFGRRCGLQEYMRLGALLSQNLRKGTKGLNDLLRIEVVQAFEERKARAKRLGEEAGTKLLMPMFLMLAVVLVIVVVPAFLSIQI